MVQAFLNVFPPLPLPIKNDLMPFHPRVIGLSLLWKWSLFGTSDLKARWDTTLLKVKKTLRV
jgi:hypothetical protein